MNFNLRDWSDRRDSMKYLTRSRESGSDFYNLNGLSIKFKAWRLSSCSVLWTLTNIWNFTLRYISRIIQPSHVNASVHGIPIIICTKVSFISLCVQRFCMYCHVSQIQSIMFLNLDHFGNHRWQSCNIKERWGSFSLFLSLSLSLSLFFISAHWIKWNFSACLSPFLSISVDISYNF